MSDRRFTMGALVLAAGLAAAPAFAQVTVNPGALDAPAPTHSTRPPARTPARPPQRPAGPSNPPHPAAAPTVRLPAVPAPAPPPAPVVPPAVVVPLARPIPPPPVSVVADAKGDATPLPAGGVRVTFGAGSSDLNPATESAIRTFGRSLKDNDQAAISVMAYASGSPDDPSTSRRMSLARALAARGVLISEGIVSTRIYVRALGGVTPDGPPDRVDVMPAGSTPKTTPSAPAATTPATTTPAATTPGAAAPAAAPPAAKPAVGTTGGPPKP